MFCQTVQYRYAPHNDVSVNDGTHTRRRSHSIIIFTIVLQYLQYSVQKHAVQVCSLGAIGYTI
jgi:hypothetical protein